MNMNAAVLHGVNDLRLDQVPVREPLRDEVLVQVKKCGVCGTDVHMWAGTNFEGKFPFIPGHEWMGVVAAVGPEVRKIKPGDRVTGEPFIACDVCAICHDGGAPHFCPDHKYYGFTWGTPGAMADYNLSPERRIFKLPDSMTDEEGALVEAVSVAYHAIWGRGGGAGPHDRVGVFGTGPIGLLAVQIAKVSGADVLVVEPGEYRRRMALAVGADLVVDPSKEDLVARVMDFTDGLGLTLIVECSGSPAGIASTVDVIGVNGRIVLTGQSMGLKPAMEIGKTIWKHATIVGSCGAPDYFPRTLKYMAKHLADSTKVITHCYPLSDALPAFQMALKGTESGKVLLTMG
jgi:L-iditol 2-dehydrogenase